MKPLSRRTLLRGAGGVAIGLPTLEAMLNGNGTALAQGAAFPKRFVFSTCGQALGGDGHAKTVDWVVPTATGANYPETFPLQSLTVQGVKDKVSLISGLAIPRGTPNPYVDGNGDPDWGRYRTEQYNRVPASAAPDFHLGGLGPLVTGSRSQRNNGTTAPSSDVLMEQQFGAGQSTLRYLAQPAWYLSASAPYGRDVISYRATGQEIPAVVSPLLAFNSLFGNFQPPMSDPGDAVRADFDKRSRKSVLDFVLDKRQRLVSKVSRSDQVRLEQHYDQIRALEQKVSAIPPVMPMQPACRKPMAPTDPAVGGNNAGSGSGTIAPNTGYSDENYRAQVFAELIHMAFVCNLSRVAAFQLTHFQSHMNALPISTLMGNPIRADVHEVGHNGDANNRGQRAVSTILRWHIDRWAYLVKLLAATNEGTGKLLDNCALVFLPEAGHGTQLNDGTSPNSTHSTENMIALVAGGAGGLVQGVHIDGRTLHPAQVTLTAMRAVGYAQTTYGEVTGEIPGLRA